jgi:putative intracellular protease/amidase
MSGKAVLIVLPQANFDPTQVAVCWQLLRAAGLEVRFATAAGRPSCADPFLLDGRGLDLWSALPGVRYFKLLGLAMRARGEVREICTRLSADAAFRKPLRFSRLHADDHSGILLPGGPRQQSMRPYLEDRRLQALVVEFFAQNKPVAAIGHGVLLAARSRRPDQRSVLHGRKTTALPWQMERDAWNLNRFLGRVWDPDGCRVYPEQRGEPEGYQSVQAQVTRALARPTDYVDVAPDASDFLRKTSGLFRDSPDDSRPAWVLCDDNYISARWAGDAYTFARIFAERLQAPQQLKARAAAAQQKA